MCFSLTNLTEFYIYQIVLLFEGLANDDDDDDDDDLVEAANLLGSIQT